MLRTRFLGRCVPLTVALVSAGLSLSGLHGAAPGPAIRDEGRQIILDTAYARLVVSRDGQTLGFFDVRSAVDYLDHSSPTSFMTARRGRVEYPSTELTREGEYLRVKFGGSGLEAVVRVAVMPQYITVEVISVNQTMIDELVIVDLPLTISQRVARVQEIREHSQTINVCRNQDFGVALPSLSLIADSRTVRYEPAAFRSSCYPRFGLVGAKIAIVAGPADQLLNFLGILETEQGLPHPTLGGEWGKVSQDVRKSYLFVDYTEENVEHVIRRAQQGGFGYILNYGGTWATSDGKYQVNGDNFPGGYTGLKSTMDKIHQAGLKGGAHILSGCISRNDAYLTPVPDPRLAKDDMRILARDISENEVTIPVTRTPRGLPEEEEHGFGRGVSVVIDDEVIAYGGLATDAPFALTNCVRGAYGTRAAVHEKGAPVYHLAQRWDRFAVDGNSSMLEEVASNVADIINEVGFDMIYFDGLDGVEVNGPFFYYVGKMVHETTKRFEREVLVQGSNLAHFNWHDFSRLYTIDFAVLDPKRWVDHHCSQRLPNAINSLLPAELGWHGFFLETDSSESTTPDVIEYVLAKTVGWDVPWSLETRMRVLDGNGRTDECLSLAKVYEQLRLEHYFSEKVRQRLRTPNQDFTLRKDSTGGWGMHPVRYGPARRVGQQDGADNVWTYQNEYPPQALKMRVKARPSPADYGDQENIVLLGRGSSDQWTGESMVPGVALSVEEVAKPVDSREALWRLRTENPSASPSSWMFQSTTLAVPLDLERNRAIGLWVYGDRSGAVLDIRLNDGRFARDHLLHLDFEGWKYCEFPEPTGGDVLRYPFPGYELMSLRSFDYSSVVSLSLFVTDVPPGTRVNCLIGRVEALRERGTMITNPRLSVNGEEVELPVTLETNQYLELWDGSEFNHYDQDGHLLTRKVVGVPLPTLRSGANRVEYRSDSYTGAREQVRVEIITMGDAISDH